MLLHASCGGDGQCQCGARLRRQRKTARDGDEEADGSASRPAAEVVSVLACCKVRITLEREISRRPKLVGDEANFINMGEKEILDWPD
jgi:hypothetical protein